MGKLSSRQINKRQHCKISNSQDYAEYLLFQDPTKGKWDQISMPNCQYYSAGIFYECKNSDLDSFFERKWSVLWSRMHSGLGKSAGVAVRAQYYSRWYKVLDQVCLNFLFVSGLDSVFQLTYAPGSVFSTRVFCKGIT